MCRVRYGGGRSPPVLSIHPKRACCRESGSRATAPAAGCCPGEGDRTSATPEPAREQTMKLLLRGALFMCRLGTRALPPELRERFALDIDEIATRRIDDASRTGGTLGVISAASRETFDLITSGFRDR